MRISKRLLSLILLLGVSVALYRVVPHANAEAPAPDAYEENDSLYEASNIPHSVVLTKLTISPVHAPAY